MAPRGQKRVPRIRQSSYAHAYIKAKKKILKPPKLAGIGVKVKRGLVS